eukprot:524655_1
MAHSATNDPFSWISSEINPENNQTKETKQTKQNGTSINDMIENHHNKHNNIQTSSKTLYSDHIESKPPQNNKQFLSSDINLFNNKQTNKQTISQTQQPLDLNFLFNNTTNDKDKDMIAESDDDKDEKYNNNNKLLPHNFDTNIFKTILTNSTANTNIIFSPLSILSAMTICLCGAKHNTLKQMLSVLHPQIKTKTEAQLSMQSNTKYLTDKYSGLNNTPLVKIANKLWIANRYKILDTFVLFIGQKRNIIDTFNVNQPEVAANIINNWCSNMTDNKIKNIISPKFINPNTKLIIANAIYFKGKFVIPFDRNNNIHNAGFYGNKNRIDKIATVTMMYSSKYQIFAQKVNGTYDIVKLRYKNSNLSLICVINNYSIRNKKQLTMKQISNALCGINFRKLQLYLPKFKYEFRIQLNDVLQEMGITDGFDEKADFSDINGKKELKISQVIHKAIIEVDEEGTIAAAVTIVSMDNFGGVMIQKQPPKIKFDHPFVFYVYDDAKNITLFSGKYVGK